MAIKVYWRLNGNSNDASGNGNNGTDSNITYSQANGVLNQGAGFNGTSSKIIKSSAIIPLSTTPFTVSILFNSSYNGTNYSQAVLRIDNELVSPRKLAGFQFHESATPGKIKFVIYNSSVGAIEVYSTITVNDGRWHNIVFVRAISGSYLYIDGRLNNSGSASTMNLDISNQILCIGNVTYSGSTQEWFNGKLDEVVVDNKEWTPAYVKNEYSRIKGFF